MMYICMDCLEYESDDTIIAEIGNVSGARGFLGI